ISKGVIRLRSSLWWAPLPIITTSSRRPRSLTHRPRVRSQSPRRTGGPYRTWCRPRRRPHRAARSTVLPDLLLRNGSSRCPARSTPPASLRRAPVRSSRRNILAGVPEPPRGPYAVHSPHHRERLVQWHYIALHLTCLQAPHDLGGLVIEAVAGDRGFDGLILCTRSGDGHRLRTPPGGVDPDIGFGSHNGRLLGRICPDTYGQVGEPSAFVLEYYGSLLVDARLPEMRQAHKPRRPSEDHGGERDAVAPDVEQGSPAEPPFEEPGCGVEIRPESEVHVQHPHLAYCSFGEQPPHLLHQGEEPGPHAFHDEESLLPGQFDHPFGLCGVHAERLLAEHGLPGLEA